MIIVQPSSPWWPLAVAHMLGQKKAPGIYNLSYQDWILWPDSPIEELA